MQKKAMSILGCLVLACLGCGSRPTLVQTGSALDQLQVIVHLKTRSEVTTVMSGRKGRAYTIRAKDGKILEQQISESELWTKFPAIYLLLKTSYADQSKNSAIWAGDNP